jgi:uncharacterized flavoprotein (TIGR03862 family)
MTNCASSIAIVGGGPAGLMAAEVLSSKGLQVDLYDAMPSVGRKFLLAGKGGLNLTHSEVADQFVTRYGQSQLHIQPMLDSLGAKQIRAWALGLGIETFVGTSGRVFPKDMKAAPLLRAWLHRLRHPSEGGVPVRFHMRHKWTGWNEAGELTFNAPQGTASVACASVILALGGASWKRLGSDGAWTGVLKERGVDIAPLVPSNCGFDALVPWSEHFKSRFAGRPLKTVAMQIGDSKWRRGECVITETGVEGSLIYVLSSALREAISANGHATFLLDLLPDFSPERVLREMEYPRGSKSLSSHLKSRLGLDGLKMGLLHELLPKTQMGIALQLAKACKALPIRLGRTRPIDEAISTAGGVRFESMTDGLMLKQLPSVFCAGEMLDWEAPTGGYLLTASLASGKRAAEGVIAHAALS